MSRHRTQLSAFLTLCLSALALSGCGGGKSSPTTPKTPPSVNGTYTIDGPCAVFGGSEVPNFNGLFGTMSITNQSGTTATNSVSLMLLDQGIIAMAIDSIPSDSLVAVSDSLSNGTEPIPPAATIPSAQVQVANDGTFSVTFNGTVALAGSPAITYQLTFTGAVGSTGKITGNWSETWGPNTERGTFTATPTP